MYEFSIDGMTCVNCSTAIENGLTIEFKSKGLLVENQDEVNKNKDVAKRYGINVILLMHKMKISFYKNLSYQHKIDENKIIEEVEDLGFGAKFTKQYEL